MRQLSTLSPTVSLINADRYAPALEPGLRAAREADAEWFRLNPHARAMMRPPCESEQLLAATHGARCTRVEVRRRRSGMIASFCAFDGDIYTGEAVELQAPSARELGPSRIKPTGFKKLKK
jgi:hypothetical protein